MNRSNRVIRFSIPNYLTLIRILLACAVIYTIVTRAPVLVTVVIFVIAALTDLLDGLIARNYGLVTKFGAQADMVADRFLWGGTALAILIVLGGAGRLTPFETLQLAAIMTREIVSAPFALFALIRGRAFPPARYIAKVTTFLQGFALPALLLGRSYPLWIYVSAPLSIAIAVTGGVAACSYIRDVRVRT